MEHNIVDNEERIDRYLCGKMSQEESKEFEKELKENNDLRHQAEAVAQMVMAMKAVGERKDRELISGIRSQNTNTESDQHERAKVKPYKSIVYRISIAACIIGVAFGGYRYYDYTVVTSLGKEYANAFPFTEVTRGDSDDAVETELATLFDNIAQGKNLKQSVAQLDVLWELSHSEIYNNYTEYEPYIGWYLAIGYLQSNNKKQAKCVLECLKDISINESLLGDTVSKILSEI